MSTTAAAPTTADTGPAGPLVGAQSQTPPVRSVGGGGLDRRVGVFFPVFWMVLTAFKQEVDAYTTTPKIFFVPTLDEFRAVFEQGWARRC